jgi:hypothetical protein
MMTTKFKNEHGYKSTGKFSVSLTLTTTCDAREAPMLLEILGCDDPNCLVKERTVIERTVGPELQGILYSVVKQYLREQATSFRQNSFRNPMSLAGDKTVKKITSEEGPTVTATS